MKRIAVGEWRWAQAVSPGRRSWTAPTRVLVVAHWPARPGLKSWDGAALLADGDDVAGLADRRFEEVPFPDIRDGFGLGMGRHLAGELPEAVHMGGVHAVVEVGRDGFQGLLGHEAIPPWLYR